MKYLAVFIFWCLQFSSSYADQNSFKDTHQLELLAHKLSSEFAAFIYFEGQQKYLIQAEKTAKQGQALIPTAITDKAAQADIAKYWQEAMEFINSNASASFNGIEMRLEAGWSLHMLELIEKISNYKKTLTAPELTSNGKVIFELQIEIERLLSQYMKLANSTTGGYGVSRSGDPIEAKVERISKMMTQLEDKPALNKIKRKWTYIEKTILKYNENIAPYIVIHVVNDLRKLTQQQLK